MAKAKKKVAKKKTAKKKVKKKSAVKKPSSKKSAKPKREIYVKVSTKILGEAPKESEFYVSDGSRLKNVFELVDALEDMHDKVFKEHVNGTKNDFSNWIKDVFDEEHMAKEISKLNSRMDTHRLLLKGLVKAAKEVAEKEHTK